MVKTFRFTIMHDSVIDCKVMITVQLCMCVPVRTSVDMRLLTLGLTSHMTALNSRETYEAQQLHSVQGLLIVLSFYATTYQSCDRQHQIRFKI